MNKRIISPSLLSADFSNVLNDIVRVEKLGIDRLHLDIMDGHFVPNITFGPFIIKHIRNVTKSHLESHLMIEEPSKYLDEFIKCGSDTIIIHHEIKESKIDSLKYIRNNNVKSGIAINPDTNYDVISEYIDYIDYVLVMSVFPGFGGQSFIYDTLEKMKQIRKITKNKNILIGVDGGVNIKTIDDVYSTGVDITIVGSGLYGADNIKERYNQLINNE
tara:strand:- start:318 stop:968 length:651 start_codon:yes stop_codon:yes gene_type:complete